jgi:chaperonin GroES
MILKPIHDRVIVKKDDPKTVTTGGIFIPDAAIEKVTQGTVLAVGPGKHAEKTGVFIPTTLTVGEKVLFHPFAGSEMIIGKQSLYNMPEGDIWAVVEDDPVEE